MAALSELIEEYVDAEKYNEFRNELGRKIGAIENDEVRGNALSIFQPNYTDSDFNKIRLIFLAYHLNNGTHVNIKIPLKDQKSIERLAEAALMFSKEVRYYLFPNETRIDLDPNGLRAALGTTYYLQAMFNAAERISNAAGPIASAAVSVVCDVGASGAEMVVEKYKGFFAASPKKESSEANQRALIPG